MMMAFREKAEVIQMQQPDYSQLQEGSNHH